MNGYLGVSDRIQEPKTKEWFTQTFCLKKKLAILLDIPIIRKIEKGVWKSFDAMTSNEKVVSSMLAMANIHEALGRECKMLVELMQGQRTKFPPKLGIDVTIILSRNMKFDMYMFKNFVQCYFIFSFSLKTL